MLEKIPCWIWLERLVNWVANDAFAAGPPLPNRVAICVRATAAILLAAIYNNKLRKLKKKNKPIKYIQEKGNDVNHHLA